jgi:hypothetical protein
MTNCSNNDDIISFNASLGKALSLTKGHDYKITASEAKTQVLAFVTDLSAGTRSADVRQVESVIPWCYDDIFVSSRSDSDQGLIPDTMLYIVNFKNNLGYALVSADKRVDGVMALVDSGSLSPDMNIDNPGLEIFLGGLREYFLTKLSNYSPTIPRDTLVTDTLINGHDPGILPRWTITERIDPVLTTEWGQRAPYNTYCFTSGGEQAKAGCGAIAIAQVLGYHRYPSTYKGRVIHWDEIMQSEQPVTDTACDDLAYLISEIGVLTNMQYGVSQSLTTPANIDTCLNILNVRHELDVALGDSFYTGTHFERLMSDFALGRPVIISGHGHQYITLNNASCPLPFRHLWVLDGGLVRHDNLAMMSGNNVQQADYHYVHCNWGWYGEDNGYFINEAFRKQYIEEEDTVELSQYDITWGFCMFYDTYPNIW